MKISYNWLKDYLNIDFSAQQLAAYLTEMGLEVSKIERYESVKGGLEGLVIGKVLTCAKHPNADKLSVTTVDTGSAVLPIVCGAPNVAAGQKVIVAVVGTVLYSGDEAWDIKKSKIRGEVSEGMICAEDEIGLGHGHDGIMVLPDDVQIGMPAKEYFKVYTDDVLEVDLTPNRQDAFSHYGIARDLYAYLSVNTKLNLKLQLPDVSSFAKDNNDLNIEVEVKNQQACPRYSGVTVTGLTVKDSPEWLQNRLKAISLKPISNVVDITNYVLHEIGHPLHAFDSQLIKGNKIVVSTVETGTKFKTLDERELELTSEDLMICDGNLTPMCIGGVMGGLESGVKESTNAVFIESAFFNPVWVRKTAKRFTISSDSSYRFERGVDPNSGLWAMKRAALLMKELAGGKISSDIKDFYPEKINDFKVELTYSQLYKILGFKIEQEKLLKILQVLEIKVISENQNGLMLEVPTFRYEVRDQEDVIEDVLRIYGYNHIVIPENYNARTLVQEENISEKYKLKIAHLLTGNGFYEIMSFSLLDGETYEKVDGFDAENAIKLCNPLSKKLDTMRQSLVFGALDAVNRNINYQQPNLKLYEFGSTYIKTNATDVKEKYFQKFILGITITGLKEKQNWKTPAVSSDFYTLKSYCEAVLTGMNFQVKKFTVSNLNDAQFKFGLEYKLGNDIVIRMGSVSKKLLKMYDVDQEVFFAEIDWGYLMTKINEQKTFKEMVKFQKVKRDLSMLINSEIKYGEIEKIGYESNKQLIKEINIFDVYEGKNIPEGKKSYAISFYIQDETKTLTEQEIESVMNKLIKNYTEKVGAEIRM